MTTPHTPALPYITLDVFTTTRFGGNPLALILLKDNDASPSPNQAEKQAIAREFNYSETVFLHLSSASLASREWVYDIFTTESELPFAGHPTIGTAWYLCKLYPELLLSSSSSSSSSSPNDKKSGSSSSSSKPARLLSKAGPVDLHFTRLSSGHINATASLPHAVHTHASSLSRSDLLAMQPGLSAFSADLASTHPIVSIVRGMTFAYIRVPSMAALRAIQLSVLPSEQFMQLDKEWAPSFTATYFYHVDDEGVEQQQQQSKGDGNGGGRRSREYKLNCRMIETAFGEDAATGSGSAGLAAYLAMSEKGEGDGDGVGVVKFCINQGVEMGRPSRIEIEVELDEGMKSVKRIRQSGSCVQVMSGTLE